MHAPLLFYRRLVVVCLLWAILIGIASVTGLLDLWYRQTAPEFLRVFPAQWALFRAGAHWNPFLYVDHLYCWWSGERSWYTIYITTSPTISVRMPGQLPPIAAQNAGALLGNWVIAPNPLQYLPDPAARFARQSETQALATVLHAYWWATQRGGVVMLAVLLVCGGLLRCQQRWQQRPRRPRQKPHVTLALTDAMFAERLCTMEVSQRRAWHLPLARLVDEAVPGSRTARAIVRVFAAHAAWPASLHHHGSSAGGLLAHTHAVLTQAVAQSEAHEVMLKPTFLLAALAHDLGKVQTYAPDGTGGFVYTAGFHPNRSADIVLSLPAFPHDLPAEQRTILLMALRCSAGRALTPVPQNAPAAVHDLLTWLREIDHAAIRADVTELAAVLRGIDGVTHIPALLTARAPMPVLPAPVYRVPGEEQPYLVRDVARVVWLTLLDLTDHPGAQATTGRHDPVWEHLLHSLQAHGMQLGEEQWQVLPDGTTRVRVIPLARDDTQPIAAATRAAAERVEVHTESEEEI